MSCDHYVAPKNFFSRAQKNSPVFNFVMMHFPANPRVFLNSFFSLRNRTIFSTHKRTLISSIYCKHSKSPQLETHGFQCMIRVRKIVILNVTSNYSCRYSTWVSVLSYISPLFNEAFVAHNILYTYLSNINQIKTKLGLSYSFTVTALTFIKALICCITVCKSLNIKMKHIFKWSSW